MHKTAFVIQCEILEMDSNLVNRLSLFDATLIPPMYFDA